MTRLPARHIHEAEFLSTLAHPLRLQILELLRGGEMCVCDLQAALKQRQACVSQHLMALREAGVVTCRKAGLRVYYQIGDARLPELLDNIEAVVLPGERR
jgi:ArsR family transcriptional regulator